MIESKLKNSVLVQANLHCECVESMCIIYEVKVLLSAKLPVSVVSESLCNCRSQISAPYTVLCEQLGRDDREEMRQNPPTHILLHMPTE